MDPIAFSRITAPPLIPSPGQTGAAQAGTVQTGRAQAGTGQAGTGQAGTGQAGAAQAGSFAALLGDAISRVQQVQGDAEQELRKLLAGEPVELHRVMLASEQAGLASELLMAVRNKVVDAYQEVMRIQV
jgi:flagellar hook-basal body complex protein FliE